LTLFVVFVLAATAQDKPPLKLIATTRRPKLVGDLGFSLPTSRVIAYFSAENSKTVEVFNLRAGKWIITGTDTATVIEQRDADHYEVYEVLP
jgi:hypothetical protein